MANLSRRSLLQGFCSLALLAPLARIGGREESLEGEVAQDPVTYNVEVAIRAMDPEAIIAALDSDKVRMHIMEALSGPYEGCRA